MKTFLKSDVKTKVRIIKPILDEWNDTIRDNWEIVPSVPDVPSCKGCNIRRKSFRPHGSFHGSLLLAIAGVCEAYDWVWAIYSDENGQLYINL